MSLNAEQVYDEAVMLNLLIDIVHDRPLNLEHSLWFQEAQDVVRRILDPCSVGNHNYDFNRHCGVQVCYECRDHKGLVRCYCGWAASGGDGHAELIAMGETI